MNIIDVQDQLKNFSEQQLISEMQMPSGSAPQFLVLSEIKRRKRVRDDFMKREAANQPTVAEEAIAAAGVPQSGVMGMSEAMAPQAAVAEGGIGSVMPQSMRPQTMPAPTDDAIPMRSGGLAQFGQELSGKVSEGVEPFLDEVEGMAQDRFGVDVSGPLQGGIADLSRPPYEIARPTQDFMGRIPPFMRQPGFSARPAVLPAFPIRRGGKGGPRFSNMMVPNSELGLAQRQDRAFAEGGVVRAANGLPLGLRQNNPGNIRPGAGFYGETGQGGGYAEFGSEDEGLRALARLLGTYSDKYGINTLRGLTSRYAPRSDNKKSFDNYISYLGETLGMDPDEEFDLKGRRDDLIPAIVGFEQGRDYEGRYSDDQIARAIRASGTEDEAEIAEILASGSEPSVLDRVVDAAKSAGTAISDAVIPSATASTYGPEMTEVENKTPQQIFDEMQEDKGGIPFPSSFGELFTFGRDDNVPTSERVGSRQDLLGQARGEQQDYLAGLYGDQITESSDAYKAHVDRARSTGQTPMSPEDFRAFFGRNVDVDGIAGDSPASRFAPFSAVATGEAGADFATQESETAATQAMSGDSEAAAQTVIDAQEEVNNILREGQRSAEERGERADYRKTLRDSDNRGGAPTSTGGQGAASADGQNAVISNNQPSGTVSPLEQEILDLQKKLERDRDTDKYLALAQAGLALMSSKDPTLLGAIGEAGVSGLSAYREAQDRYNEGVVDLINARSKLAKGDGGLGAFKGDAGNAITRLGQIERALAGADGMTLTDEKRNRLLQEALFLQRIVGVPELTTGATSAAPTS